MEELIKFKCTDRALLFHEYMFNRVNRVRLSLILATLLFAACGEIVEIDGVVIAAATRRPLAGAIIEVGIYDRWSVFDTTDATGRFQVSMPANGMACGVPPGRVYADREGYAGRREIYTSSKSGVIIPLKKE